MTVRWIGAALILGGCGGYGFFAAAAGRRETQAIQELYKALNLMQCELKYKLTALPDLCRKAAEDSSGCIREVFLNLTRELNWQHYPDAAGCMSEAIRKSHRLPDIARRLLLQLGVSLGRYDLSGQLKQLEQLSCACEDILKNASLHQKQTLRNYQTLGLCTGAVLAILFL